MRFQCPPRHTADTHKPVLPNRRSGAGDQVPAIYKLRVAPDRSARAQLHGGTRETEEAVKAVSRWKFEPATLNGKPVAVYYNMTANFRLQ